MLFYNILVSAMALTTSFIHDYKKIRILKTKKQKPQNLGAEERRVKLYT